MNKQKTVCPKCKKGFHWANQLFDALKNRKDPSELITLTIVQKAVFTRINEALKLVWVDRCPGILLYG